MFRLIGVCLLLSAGAVGLVYFLTLPARNAPPAGAAEPKPPEHQPEEYAPPPPAAAQPRASSSHGAPKLVLFPAATGGLAEPVIIPRCNLVITDQQEVPAEKEGKLLFIGTDIKEGEVVPPERRIPDAELGFLTIQVEKVDRHPDEPKFTFPDDPKTVYRRWLPDDDLPPGKLRLAREKHTVRKLVVGDKVERGQLVAVVNPAKALDEVATKVAKVKAAEADRQTSRKQKEEYEARYRSFLEQENRAPGSVNREEMRTARMQSLRYAEEEKQKEAMTESAQRELNAALTDLKMHEIRAAIAGTIKMIYKNSEGEAVKPNESILQIQSPNHLRIEGLLDVQEALKLRRGMKVVVEASRPETPSMVLSGHLDTVNCVAVSKGPKPTIVSGSADMTLRGWNPQAGQEEWRLEGLYSAVRAVACTPPGSRQNLVLFGCADGTARILDLDKLDGGSRELAQRHDKAINAVAFSLDGEVCATAGEDLFIYLWKTSSGEMLHRLPRIHRGDVTSLQFTPKNQCVTAGRDNRLIVWDVTPGKPPVKTAEYEGRGGEVTQIGVSPDGRTVLYDQGRDLRLLSLTNGRLQGTLQNPAGVVNFSTMALFSPDSKTILTNGAAPERIQLWRTPSSQGRASELRQFIWSSGMATCGAFAPLDSEHAFVVTGTQDKQVLVWKMPEKAEVEQQLAAGLTLVEKHLDTRSRQVRVWAELDNPGWLIPGGSATMVVPPQQ
jgi:WD40 repeat protein